MFYNGNLNIYSKSFINKRNMIKFKNRSYSLENLFRVRLLLFPFVLVMLDRITEHITD